MGLDFKKIHACPTDCTLYRNEYANRTNCPTCGESRYKRKNEDDSDELIELTKIPMKVVWYMPIVQRLKRLFRNPEDAKNLRWHTKERLCDGKLHHPADSL